MKIELNFEDMKEIEDYFVRAKKNEQAASVLYEMAVFLRNETKYGDAEKWKHCYDKIWALANEESLDLLAL